MSETHRLAPADPGEAHNAGPFDPDLLAERLKRDHAALLDRQANMELAAAKLPAEVKSDADVEKVNAFVVRAKQLQRDLEDTRKDVKEPFLKAGRVVDDFFGGAGKSVENRWKGILARATAYLTAKAAAERAERERLAAEARQRQIEAAQREAEERAKREAAEAEAEAARARLTTAETSTEFAAAEDDLREAEQKRQQHAAFEDQARQDVGDAGAYADRAEEKAAGQGHTLGRVSAAGGHASVKMVWKARIVDVTALKASLGPLGAYLADQAIVDAVNRAAKAALRPTVAGVEFYEEPEANVTLARTRNS